MARPLQLSERPGWLQDANSMLVSALCHLAALIALGLLSVAGADGWRGIKLLVNLDETLESPHFDDSALDNTVKLEATDDLAAAMGPTNQVEVAAPVTSEVAALSALSENAAPLSGLDGAALGGGREGDGTAAKATAQFFGIGGYGQTFVYVVDASDSMNDNDKFERARYELLKSIEQLSSDQRYFVIFYNDGAYPMDADEPVQATQDQIAETTRWINDIQPTGGTNPLPALVYALSLRPDAIYFLSDGQFDPVAIRELRFRNRPNHRLNQRQIPIHTIAFFDRFAEGLMRTIARNSGGEYRFER